MPAPNRFLDRLVNGPPIVADGGMGALISAAVPRLRTPEEANLRAPETVVSVHLGYIRAGAELIETNTFSANRRKLRSLYLEDELERINEAGVKLAREAREASGREIFVAGSIGPLGEVRERAPADDAEVFAEQARLLEGRGVDLFMVETFFDLDDLLTALEGVRSASSLPIVALLSFDEDGETPGGVLAADAAERLAPLGLAAVGTNHGSGPHAALTALDGMQHDGLPLAALPNVGLASLAGGRVIYPHASPEYFAEFAAQAGALGARIIGGCCGTTPTEIAAIATAVAEERRPSASLVVVERELSRAGREPEAETELARRLAAGDPLVTVEINPPKGGSSDGMLELVGRLQESGRIDFVDINDNPTARARMHALMAAVAIESAYPIETIPHLTTRDSSIMGLESALLGAHASGVRNVLAITGDPPAVGDYPGSQGVYEVDAIGLCRIVQRLNEGESFAGKTIESPTSFHYGVAVNPSAQDLDLELRRFEEKLEAGASFAITQVLFDLAYFDEFERRLGGSWPVPVLLGLFYVTNYPLALRLHNEVPGIVVPEPIRERLRAAGPGAADVGREIARDLIEQARGRVAGIQIIPPFKQPLAALDLID